MSRTDDEIATAYHEAGHAVMALLLGRPVQRVTIEPDVLRLGRCEFKKAVYRPSDDVIETELLILLAGLAAEARRTGRYGWDEAGRDLDEVRELTLMRAGNDRQADRLERRMLDKAEHLLDRPGVWSAVEAVADDLLERTTISGRAARHHFDQAIAKSRKER